MNYLLGRTQRRLLMLPQMVSGHPGDTERRAGHGLLKIKEERTLFTVTVFRINVDVDI